ILFSSLQYQTRRSEVLCQLQRRHRKTAASPVLRTGAARSTRQVRQGPLRPGAASRAKSGTVRSWWSSQLKREHYRLIIRRRCRPNVFGINEGGDLHNYAIIRLQPHRHYHWG
ncbi:hypothetical protein ALC60_00795, partial [Trachymyrmex zeteki]